MCIKPLINLIIMSDINDYDYLQSSYEDMINDDCERAVDEELSAADFWDGDESFNYLQ